MLEVINKAFCLYFPFSRMIFEKRLVSTGILHLKIKQKNKEKVSSLCFLSRPLRNLAKIFFEELLYLSQKVALFKEQNCGP